MPFPSRARAFFGVELERYPVPRSFKVLARHLDAFRPDVVHVDAVVAGRGGALYKPGDIEDFLRTIALFVANAELRKACGARGRQFAEGLDWERTVKHWLDTITAVRPSSGLRRAGPKPDLG